MTWPLCDTDDMLTNEIIAYSKRWFRETPYKGLLPAQHIHFLKQGDEKRTGVNVRVLCLKDPQHTWQFTPESGPDTGRRILTESHAMALIIEADKPVGGSLSVTKVHSALRALFSCPDDTAERTDLIEHGINNLFESAGDGMVDPAGMHTGSQDSESTSFSLTVDLVCDTDMYLT